MCSFAGSRRPVSKTEDKSGVPMAAYRRCRLRENDECLALKRVRLLPERVASAPGERKGLRAIPGRSLILLVL